MSEKSRRPRPEDQTVLEALQVRWLERQELERCHGLLVFAAAAKHLKPRDRWIGWTEAQRERRLPLVVNHIRFLLLPDRTFPNLGTRVLRRALARLSSDWQVAYGHPVLVAAGHLPLGGALRSASRLKGPGQVCT